MFTLLLILMIPINPTGNKFDHKLYHNKLNAHSLRYIMMVLNYRAQNELLQKSINFSMELRILMVFIISIDHMVECIWKYKCILNRTQYYT